MRRVIGMLLRVLVLYFNLWYLFILAVNLALIVGVAWMDWPSKSTVGA
jgi:hypothetical protein